MSVGAERWRRRKFGSGAMLQRASASEAAAQGPLDTFSPFFFFFRLRVIVICTRLLFARHGGKQSRLARRPGYPPAPGSAGGEESGQKNAPRLKRAKERSKEGPRFENKQRGRERNAYKETHSACKVVPKTASPVGLVSFLMFCFLHSLFRTTSSSSL